MSEYQGKREVRLDMPKQLRTDAELAEDVRFIARMNRRHINQQILHWIEEGVKADKRIFSQAVSGEPKKAVRISQIQSEEKMA